MTKEQRSKIEKNLKNNQIAVDTTEIENGQDVHGFPTFETQYINPPKNYRLIALIQPYHGAILEDLDHESGI